SLALDVVAAHAGDCVIFVGEWATHLGTPAFYQKLARDFVEVGRVDLPAWWDDEIAVVFRRIA
ncbi:MAG TPA: hypothetical protein VGO62_08920, partial [Myxococcota bacterium]